MTARKKVGTKRHLAQASQQRVGFHHSRYHLHLIKMTVQKTHLAQLMVKALRACPQA